MKPLFIFILVLNSLWGFSQIDSLKQIIESHPDDSVRIEAYYAWDELIYITDPELDFEINSKVIEIVDQNVQNPNLSSLRLRYYYSAKAKSINILGLIETDRGNYPSALELFEESFLISEALVDSSQMSAAVSNLGMIYDVQGYPELSLRQYEKANLLDTEFSEESQAIYYNNIGLCYAKMKKNKLALSTYYKALELSRKIGSQQNEANVLVNIGDEYTNAFMYDSANYFYSLSIQIQEELGDENGLSYSKQRIGINYIHLKNLNLAQKHCSEGLEIAIKNGFSRNEMKCHKCLYIAYRELNNTKKALYHFELHTQLKDTILSGETLQDLIQSQYQSDYEKKRLADSLEISNQQRVKEIQLQADIDSKQITQNATYIGAGLLLILGLFVYRSYRLKKKDNEIIANQKLEVEEKNQEITDSITYAKRIQDAILPPDQLLKEAIPQGFIFYQPKDIVAGDFYWLEKIDGQVFIAAADCTGHGVPGAMVSVVCHNALNRAVREFKLRSAGEILNKTRELVIETFEKSETDVKDGMDIALCCWKEGTLELEYAGANNSLYILRNDSQQIEEIKADKQPIGKYVDSKSFTTHTIRVSQEDTIYAFTDGFADQFGGMEGKKYKYKRFKSFLKEIVNHPFDKQEELLATEFKSWKGQLEQLDDVCVVGLRIN